MGNRKRLTAFLLTAVMILTMPQMQIAAAEVESPADVGLCIHHTQHTEDCGYTEGEKGTPCGHVHTEDCYAPISSVCMSMGRAVILLRRTVHQRIRRKESRIHVPMNAVRKAAVSQKN